MKFLPLVMLLICPFMVFAETEEIDLDEEKERPANPPLKRSFAPQPKLFLIDRAEIQIDYPFSASEGSISIRDTQNSVVFQADYLSSSYSIPTLDNIQTYSITLYIDNHCYSGIILP
ncbi:MAG: hypothetical protein K2H46_05525 [Muribaculaceae bacterium]|nr:hypothetical protein [Muribaculaceae bacterium]